MYITTFSHYIKFEYSHTSNNVRHYQKDYNKLYISASKLIFLMYAYILYIWFI